MNPGGEGNPGADDDALAAFGDAVTERHALGLCDHFLEAGDVRVRTALAPQSRPILRAVFSEGVRTRSGRDDRSRDVLAHNGFLSPGQSGRIR